MSQEPLELLPFEKWSELQTMFKADWPRGISGYTVLETQRVLIEKGGNYGFKVYCPFGDLRSGMVAVNVKDTFHEIIVLCPQDDTEKLEGALTRTKIVNLQEYDVIPFAPYHVRQCVQRVLGEHVKLKLMSTDAFIYDKPTTFTGNDMPEGISFGILSSEHLDLVDSKWPYRYDSSRWYLNLMINVKFGYGLFEGGKLIAWVLLNESGALLNLYTLESHRKKGYAELIVKLVSNILVKEGKPVVAFCIKGNENGRKLYEKLGFLNTHSVEWCFLNNKFISLLDVYY
ncbi:unnamed protein product [Arctia plantaginis]|uniref:Glycine N-acyltransferase-like protein n=1 Tax=Arctia plantaginis TaxID=874455 RepID=A0A8S1BBW4_ARCPL|nr:unnamed protein product [Arctia plantaginis]